MRRLIALFTRKWRVVSRDNHASGRVVQTAVRSDDKVARISMHD